MTKRLRALVGVALVSLLMVTNEADAQLGACCSPTGTCLVTTQAICEAGGRDFLGVGTTCTPNPCNQPFGACCFPDRPCENMGMVECTSSGGVFQGDGSDCAQVTCPPLGACCLFGNLCSVAEMDNCVDGDGNWQGVGTTCSPDPCNDTSVLGDSNLHAQLLTGPFPNPTTGATRYRIDLAVSSHVWVRILDVAGRVVDEPLRSTLASGVYSMAWSGLTPSGSELPSGTYFLHIQADARRETRKIVLAR